MIDLIVEIRRSRPCERWALEVLPVARALILIQNIILSTGCCAIGLKASLCATAQDFANGFVHGGGVRHGARAQEEEICRRSGLLPALERLQFPLGLTRTGLFVGGVEYMCLPEREIPRTFLRRPLAPRHTRTVPARICPSACARMIAHALAGHE